MSEIFKPKIGVFYCINAAGGADGFPVTGAGDCELRLVKLACSSMVKDVYLLRAFEAGADAVIVLVCPEGKCRYVEGNLRARKRVIWVRKLLDDIGLGGKRLSIVNVSPEDRGRVVEAINRIKSGLAELGPSPVG